MPFTVPDVSSVGFDDPRAAGGLPVFPANDAGAEGMMTLGKGVEKGGLALADIGAMQAWQKSKIEGAYATADLRDRLAQAELQIKSETDPAKVTQLRGQLRPLVSAVSQQIGNPDRRDLWLADNLPLVSAGEVAADQRSGEIWRGNYASGLAEKITNAQQRAAQTDDPAEHEAEAKNISDLIDAGAVAGVIPPSKVSTEKQNAGQAIITNHIDWLNANGRPQDALSFLQQNNTRLPPDVLETYTRRIEAKGNKIVTDGAALRALGLPTVGAGNQPAGYLPDMGNLRLGGAIPQAIADEATRSGVSPTTALATAQIESKMGRALGTRGNIFQLGQPEWAGVGGGSMADTGTQIRNGVAFLGNTEQQLSEKLGRPALPSEVYLAHQQGVDGAISLMDHPDTPAGQLVGDQAISGNGGDPKAPASVFVGHWQNVFNRTAAGVTATMPAAAGASAPNIEVWGDSLGVGLKGQLKSPGTVQGGITPTTIFNNIKAQPADYWQGKTIALPSGSNGNEMPVVEDTIAYLKDKGAKVIAVGYGPKFPEKNAELAAIADRQKVPVIAAEGVGATEGVHPSPQGYSGMAQKIRATASSPMFSGAAPAADANAAPAIQPGATPDQLTGQPQPTATAAPGQATGAQPIPTGEAAAAPPQGRTGLPSLAETYLNILKDPAIKTDAQQEAAFRTATAVHGAFEAQAAQAERIQAQQAKATLENATNKIYADVYSPQPKITPQQIAVDPAFDSNPERRKAMIELVNNPPGTGVPAAQSYAAAQSLIDRIRLPYGNADKITTPDEIYANVHNLNRPDLEFALKTLNDSLTPQRENLTQQENRFFAGVRPQIDKSGIMAGLPSDGRGVQKFSEFQRDVSAKVDQYLREKKDPTVLFDPKNPAYAGAPEVLKPYKRTLAEALADYTNDMGADTGGAKGPVSAVEITATGPNGDHIALRQGQWVDIKTGAPLVPAGVTAPLR